MRDVSPKVYHGLPRRIHIGPYTFRVVFATARHEQLRDSDGCCVFSELRIYLRTNLNLQLAVNTVVHEVTHAINFAYGIEDGATEEFFTTNHSTGQVDVWVRNPRLMNWYVKQIRRIRQEAEHD